MPLIYNGVSVSIEKYRKELGIVFIVDSFGD